MMFFTKFIGFALMQTCCSGQDRILPLIGEKSIEKTNCLRECSSVTIKTFTKAKRPVQNNFSPSFAKLVLAIGFIKVVFGNKRLFRVEKHLINS